MNNPALIKITKPKQIAESSYRYGKKLHKSKQYNKAMFFFVKSATMGCMKSILYLARYSLYNYFSKKLAIKFLLKIKDTDRIYDQSLVLLARVYEANNDLRDAFETYFNCKENDFVCFKLGMFFFKGIGTDVDYISSINHFKKINPQYEKYEESLIYSGYIYVSQKNETDLCFVLNKASRLGNDYASYCLGIYYYNLIRKDIENVNKSLTYFKRVKSYYMYADIHYYLGSIYKYIKMHTDAYAYFMEASKHGHLLSANEICNYHTI
jgi:tetratricopeptide (TPR) repeat protein